jgi:ABC-type uncharacterized transport system permease subunit
MHELSVFWLRAAAALYAIGLLHSIQVAIRKESSLFRPALISFAAGLVLHMVAIVENGRAAGAAFPAGFLNSVSLCAFLIALLFLFVYWRYRIESLGVFVFPLVFAMTTAAALSAPVTHWSSGSDRDTWLAVHIVLVLLGYAALLVTAFAALLYLLQERQLKRKKSVRLLERLPPLGTLDALISGSLGFGFILITLGVVTGGTWAYIESGGTAAGLGDPRMSTALLTWAACFLMVALRITAGWRGRKAALMAVTVVACSAATWAFHYVRH